MAAGKKKERQYPPDVTITALFDALYGESDRGAVLVGSQWIQDSLESLLATLFLASSENPSQKDIKYLLSNDEYDPPLGGSGPRLALCRVMGLLSESESNAIACIQKIRNRFFAHYIGPATLSDPHIRDALTDLLNCWPESDREVFPSLKKNYRQVHGNSQSEQRLDFQVCVVLLYFRICQIEYRICVDHHREPSTMNSTVISNPTK